jgi:Protein of unknown function (DUF4230)
MHKLGKALIFLLVAALFAVGLFCGMKVSRWAGFGSRARTYSTPALLTQVQALSELVTIKYVIEKVEVLEVPSENVVGQMIGSQNRVLLLAHGIVKAGIDLQNLQADDLEIQGKQIAIKLPAARITDAYLDDKETKVIDRSTGLLAPPDKDIEQMTRRNALDEIRRAARNNGILTEADARAKAQLTSLFSLVGFEKVEFKRPALSGAISEKQTP